MRIRATGTTFNGSPFQREQTLTASVYPGGDRPPDRPDEVREFLCKVLTCILRGKTLDGRIVERLHALGIDVRALAECVERICRESRPKEGGSKLRSVAEGISGKLALEESAIQLLAERVLRAMKWIVLLGFGGHLVRSAVGP